MLHLQALGRWLGRFCEETRVVQATSRKEVKSGWAEFKAQATCLLHDGIPGYAA